MLTNEAGQPIQLKQHWQVYNRAGKPMTWDSVWAYNVLWHDGRDRAPRRLRPDKQVSRGIVLTEAGREYLASLRAGVKS